MYFTGGAPPIRAPPPPPAPPQSPAPPKEPAGELIANSRPPLAEASVLSSRALGKTGRCVRKMY
jgi:hypothetical protein